MEWPHLIDNSLKAHHLYKRDVNYVVQDGEVVIVDEFTGRLMPGRHWSDGLHQAVEAKEGVQIKEENQTLATITLQNFFKLYDKICRHDRHGHDRGRRVLEDLQARRHRRPHQQAAAAHRITPTSSTAREREKFTAIADEIERLNRWDHGRAEGRRRADRRHDRQRETTTRSTLQLPQNASSRRRFRASKITRHPAAAAGPSWSAPSRSRRASGSPACSSKRGIKHEVLNAKHHKREAEIVAQAGRKGAVTIATNMAGRGTDIILGGNPETMAWALLQDKYATRLDVPQDEWDAAGRRNRTARRA